ncbi:MAG: hypothetical protein H0T17_07230 [Propionibacteriales bacterium]|nr:hypothetical protein [Propionibacteriales bacterium]
MFPRHATDVISLVFGTLFAGLTVVWLLVVGDVIHFHEARIAGPVILIVAGAVGLLAALRPAANRRLETGPNLSQHDDSRHAVPHADGSNDEV